MLDLLSLVRKDWRLGAGYAVLFAAVAGAMLLEDRADFFGYVAAAMAFSQA